MYVHSMYVHSMYACFSKFVQFIQAYQFNNLYFMTYVCIHIASVNSFTIVRLTYNTSHSRVEYSIVVTNMYTCSCSF